MQRDATSPRVVNVSSRLKDTWLSTIRVSLHSMRPKGRDWYCGASTQRWELPLNLVHPNLRNAAASSHLQIHVCAGTFWHFPKRWYLTTWCAMKSPITTNSPEGVSSRMDTGTISTSQSVSSLLEVSPKDVRVAKIYSPLKNLKDVWNNGPKNLH